MSRKNIIIFLTFSFVAILGKAENTNGREYIAPFITTNWHQGTPFNLEMQKRINWLVTGCTPTALAQIMRYYRFPNNGLRDMTYKFEDKIFDYKLTQLNFNWDNMLNEYIEGKYTDAQANAVAELMFAISTTLPMNHSTDPFGSDPIPAFEAFALEQIFGYDSGMQHLEHRHFDDETWENIIYYELSKGRPVLFNGYSVGVGHSFICDGYSNGLYHFNFGWGGTDDSSYYSLDLLKPHEYGESLGFIYNQNITIGICPNGQKTDCNPYIKVDPTLVIDSDFGESFDLKPMCDVPYSCEIGVKVISSDGSTALISTNNLDINSRHVGNHTINLHSIKSQIPAGTYTITPIYRKIGSTEWSDLLVPLNKSQSAQLDISTDKIIISPNPPTYRADIQVNSFIPNTDKVTSQQQNLFSLIIDNYGDFEFTNSVEMRFYDTLNKLVATNYVYLYSHPKISSTPSLYQIFIPVDPGNYTVQFVDQTTQMAISDLLPLTVESDPSSTISVNKDNDNVPAEYFTIDGKRVQNPFLTKGIYIRRTPSKTDKIIIR